MKINQYLNGDNQLNGVHITDNIHRGPKKTVQILYPISATLELLQLLGTGEDDYKW
jgi:hypothetical protein